MAQEHDEGAERTGEFILSRIRQGDPSYKQVFSSAMNRTGDWDWPRPDFVCMDEENNVSYALEYKPPLQSKREYVCGLGQSITYLQHHNYSGLIIPQKADDGFNIADFMLNTMNSDVLIDSPISLFSYDPINFSVKILKPIRKIRTTKLTAREKKEQNKTFWCWWRDTSHYEVLDLLNLSFKYSDEEGDIYTKYVYPEFYSRLIGGQEKGFEGEWRKVQDKKKSEGSYKQNYRIPFEQLGLWTSKEGKLSHTGFKLLEIGKLYGAESSKFKNALAYLILTTGHHLELINLIEDIQKNISNCNSMQFKQRIDEELEKRGMVGKRKPSAITTNAKGSYIRDEPKLWNKFGMLKTKGNTYFDKDNCCWHFDWKRITDILVNGKDIIL